jgi:transposase
VLRVKVRDEGTVRNKAVYVALGVRPDGTKEVLGLWIEQTEGAKFWLRVMNELRDRGIGDILIAVVDGLEGFPEAIAAVFPRTQVQACIFHLLRTFKRSNDPAFAEKVENIVGLYMDPPMHTVVLSIDEKSQIQALDRTQPGLPLKPGKCGTVTHDYKRNGVTTLFAALNVQDGTVLGRCMPQHRHQEFVRFLNAVERAVPAGKLIHAIADNYATHKHPKVLAWLERHPRWVFHFTPTSASWINAVEGYFSALEPGACDEECSSPSPILSRPSPATFVSTMPPRAPSSGPSLPIRSSPNSPGCLHLPNESLH